MNRYLISNLHAMPTYQGKANSIRMAHGHITEIGQNLKPEEGEETLDGRYCVAYPGFVNTHHHLAQSVLKGIPEGRQVPLGEWLAQVPYRYWPKISPDDMYTAARVGFYELLRSGVTTCADHHYLYHASTQNELEDAVWQAANEMGIRFALCRGATTTQGSHRGMQGSSIVPETLDLAMNRLEATLARYHDPSPDSMRRLVVAPTSLIHTSPEEDLIAFAQFAKANGLKRHSHLLEVGYDEEMALIKYGMSAIDYVESCDWLGEDVWFAHLVKADAHAMTKLAQTGTGIAHCPTSNSRLGSGIAPVSAMVQAGMKITLGVDGSASSESGSMLQEMNLAWLIHRTQAGANATSPDQVLSWATENGANLLGLNTGKLEVGSAADIVLYRLDTPRLAGIHQLEWAPIMAGEPCELRASFVQGKKVVDSGSVIGVDEATLTQDAIAVVARLKAIVNS